jgi:hypothetical protein
MSDLDVKPGDLRVSAAMAARINGKDLHDRIDQALAGTATAAAALRGWSLGPEADALAGTWQPALKGLQERLAAAASALRDCAAGHEWNETLTTRDFEGI